MASRLERDGCCIFVGGYRGRGSAQREHERTPSDVKRGTEIEKEKDEARDGKENFIFGGWFK